MRYFFIVNPNSGKKKKQRHMIESLEIAAVRLGIKYEIHYTRGTKDGEIYVRNLCRKYSGTDEKLRIYACGGDGTINEVVNGAFGYGNVEIGAIPLGTGNDYIRNYGITFIIATLFSTPIIKNIYNKFVKSDILNTIILITIFLLCIAYLVDATYNPFLYFRF